MGCWPGYCSGAVAALLIIPSIVTNTWQLVAGGQLRGLIKRLWPMQLGIFLGTGLGMLWLAT